MSGYQYLPYSHNGLKVFECVARLMSFTKAAEELNVTQSAVSRQVRQLENDLNVLLVVRRHRAIALTEKGRDLYQRLNSHYRELDALFREWSTTHKQRIVIKSALSYATRTLMPQVVRLNERYPEYEIVIIPSIEESPDLETEDCDLLIVNTCQRERYIGKKGVTFLREEYMAPVYAKSLSEHNIPLQDVLTLPHLHSTLDHQDWKYWLTKANLQGTKRRRDTVFYSLDLALSACLAGQGVTVTDLLLVLPELNREFLKCPDDVVLQHSQWQYFCYQPNRSSVIDEIHDWLVEQTQSELGQLKAMCKSFGWDSTKVELPYC
ncbi:LysR family transcriptional regulator [Vibrio zhanjiangensis]|uniref:LysR family transcriptional regulator n=1 Tax=Vibrio zhanjiangensis TaxID=1046128 RepID=A0ABQ6F470_9VIBR|nr:LysR family transcriptional regulator [Vibrio zhanjiangensis]GLT20019.1 LysR family transcriptional regulator [Vibrio zhanjiangensis]